MVEQTKYRVKADFIEVCNCDPGCNCNFGGFPDHGKCEGIAAMQINEGKFGDVDLTGMKAIVAVKWPGAVHDGNGTAVIFIDDSATQNQVDGLTNILTGQSGGMPWEIYASTISSAVGPVVTPIQMTMNGRHSHFSINGVLEAQMVPLKNPVTGEENEVHIVFPNGGMVWDEGDIATTTVMHIDHEIVTFAHPGQSGTFARVDWSN
jgi:hypothetical protein